MSSKISIITCTFNSQRFLQDTIDSVISQTYTDYEHVFIDGYSTDNTLQIIKNYQSKFPDKVFLYQQKPEGITAAMNYGVMRAKGDIICHLHSDDLFCGPNTLKTVSDFFAKQKVDWCYGDIEIINPDGSVYNREIPPRFSYKKLLARNFIPHPATFIKRTFFNSLGGFGNFEYAMDYDLWLRAAKMSEPKKIDSFLTKFRRHSGGKSNRWVIPTLREDYQIRLANSSNLFQKAIFGLDYCFRISKFKIAKLLGRA